MKLSSSAYGCGCSDRRWTCDKAVHSAEEGVPPEWQQLDGRRANYPMRVNVSMYFWPWVKLVYVSAASPGSRVTSYSGATDEVPSLSGTILILNLPG